MLDLTNKSGSPSPYSRKSNVRSFVKKGTGSGKENDFS